jgi:hypothetical protein
MLLGAALGALGIAPALHDELTEAKRLDLAKILGQKWPFLHGHFCMYLKELQDSGLGDSSESALTRSCASPAHVKRIGTLVTRFRRKRASQREADNLQTEVSALDYRGPLNLRWSAI